MPCSLRSPPSENNFKVCILQRNVLCSWSDDGKNQATILGDHEKFESVISPMLNAKVSKSNKFRAAKTKKALFFLIWSNKETATKRDFTVE